MAGQWPTDPYSNPHTHTTTTKTEPFVLDFEEAQLTEQNVRDLVYEEMRKYQADNNAAAAGGGAAGAGAANGAAVSAAPAAAV